MKTNGTIKKLLVGAIAATMILGAQMTAFAAVDASSEAPADTSPINGEVDTTAEIAGENQPEGTVNDSPNPNTGVSAMPIAAAILAIGAVPVILKTRKK